MMQHLSFKTKQSLKQMQKGRAKKEEPANPYDSEFIKSQLTLVK